jgi:hypothetical protein
MGIEHGIFCSFHLFLSDFAADQHGLKIRGLPDAMTFSITDLIVTLSIMTLGISIKCHCVECCYVENHYADCRYADCHYAECRKAECHGVTYPECSTFQMLRSRVGSYPYP